MSVMVVDSWLKAPLRQFVDDASVELALLLHPSGQVLAQFGFARAIDVMSACALAAAIHATSQALGELVDERAFCSLHHAGVNRQIFIAEARPARAAYIFVTVFGQDSSLGLVRLYFEDLVTALSAATPSDSPAPPPALADHFEQDLNRNLAVLFGRS